VIHYHGTPITPRAKLLELAGCNFCVSYAEPRDVAVCHEIGQSVMLDNGAFTTWKQRRAFDVDGFMDWAEPWLDFWTTWAVIPDVIDGDEEDNDRLLVRWFQRRLRGGAPVWHMHEPLDRLKRLALGYERICIGSSGEYAIVGGDRWRRRMDEAFNAIAAEGRPEAWVHMLRGLKLCGDEYPFASADSTNVAANHAGNNTRATPAKDIRALALRMDAVQCPARWTVRYPHPTFFDHEEAHA
jgi:hypothetical protein